MRAQSRGVDDDELHADRAREQVYQDYVAECEELGVAPLPFPDLLVLLETLAEWPSAILQ